MKPADNDEQWKRKYYDSLEELEHKEQSWVELENLLRSLTIRMSLAIEGLDNSMDRQLDSLRSTLRKKPGKAELVKTINGITSALDDLDKLKAEAARKGEHGDSEYGFQVMLKILKDLDLPPEYAAPYKELQKDLLKCNKDSVIDPYVQQFHQLLSNILEDYVSLQSGSSATSPSEKKKGVLGRIFNKENSKEVSKPELSQPEPSNCQSGIDVINVLASRLTPGGNTNQQIKQIGAKAKQIENGQGLLELANDLARSLNSLWHEQNQESDQEPNQEPDNRDLAFDLSVNEVLLQLLDRLSLPVDCQQKVALLQTRLEDVVEEKEWPELLDQIASLVGSIRKKVQAEKKDLENFLSHMTKRLQAIDNSLQGVKQDQKVSYDNTLQLNSVVGAQMQELRDTVQSASDITQLKTVVETRLDAITDHMEKFRIKELQRDQKSRDRIGELTERLAVMEKETVELRGKVVKQRKAAMLDRLTGLPNRSAYDERLDQEYRRWRRFHDHLCMVVIDVDLFKSVNDNYGHKAGDKVLATIAAVLKDKVRETDFVARYGGEEFVALVTGAKLDDAFAVADKLRSAVESCGFHFRGARVPITISAGIAEFCKNDTPDDVFERADKAMYEAKHAGRNQCKTALPCPDTDNQQEP